MQVRGDQEVQAREVLAAMKRGDLELPDAFDAETVREPSPAANPVAPAEQGLLSRLLILAIGVAVTVWLWATLTH